MLIKMFHTKAETSIKYLESDNPPFSKLHIETDSAHLGQSFHKHSQSTKTSKSLMGEQHKNA